MKIKLGLSNSIRIGSLGLQGSSVVAVASYSISGTVFDTNGSTPVSGAVVALGSSNATSAADGTFTISGLSAGTSGSMTCTKSGYNWTAISISAMAGNLTNQNYTANWNLISNLRSYWKLEENGTSDRVDELGNNNLTPSATIPNGTGKFNNGLAANGTAIVEKTTGVSENLANGCTAWGWINVSNFTGRKGILHDSTSVNMELKVESNTNIVFTIADTVSGNSNASKTGLSLLTGTWYFVWGRYDSSTKKAEVGYDAVAGTLGSALSNAAKTITRLGIGQASATVFANATIDEVGFALRKFTDAEIAALYNGGTGLQYPF